MRLLLDTNRYVDVLNAHAEALDVVERAERVYLSFATLAELRVGFVGGSKRQQNEHRLAVFLKKPNVRLLFPDEQTTHQYAAIFHQLARQGTPIPTNDVWIAALALQHTLTLFARDAHFKHLPQLDLI